MNLRKTLSHNEPHPLSCRTSANRLNPKAFIRIEGDGPYEVYSWDDDGSNFGVDVDCGGGLDNLNLLIELYESEECITAMESYRAYRFPKEYYVLVKSNNFDTWVLSQLKNDLPPHIFDSIKKAQKLV